MPISERAFHGYVILAIFMGFYVVIRLLGIREVGVKKLNEKRAAENIINISKPSENT